MKDDPFGNLTDWGTALHTIENLSNNGDLSQCQPGLIRILRHKGNWRLREEVLKCVGEVETPSKELFDQVIDILANDNIYYDARIIAGNALIKMLKNTGHIIGEDIHGTVRKLIEKLKSLPQPLFFDKAIDRLYSELAAPTLLGN